MHTFHILKWSIQNSNVRISALNGALWDMEEVHSGICEIYLLVLWLGSCLCALLTANIVAMVLCIHKNEIISLASEHEQLFWYSKDRTPAPYLQINWNELERVRVEWTSSLRQVYLHATQYVTVYILIQQSTQICYSNRPGSIYQHVKWLVLYFATRSLNAKSQNCGITYM